MKLRNILIGCVALLVICAVAVAVAFAVAGPAISNIFNSIAAPITASNDFMNAVVAKDYTKAYGLVHSSQQTSFGGSSDGMKQLFSGNGWEPSAFTFSQMQSLTTGDAVVNDTGTFSGTTKYITMFLRKDGDVWKILGFNVSTTQPTAIPTSSS